MKSFRIPKVTNATTLQVRKKGIKQFPKSIQVTLKPQTIEGTNIPEMQCFIPHTKKEHVNLITGNVLAPAWKVNEILKFVTIQNIRNAPPP